MGSPDRGKRVEDEALQRLKPHALRGQGLGACSCTLTPRNAYHSQTDDSYPVVTALGALSVGIDRRAIHGHEGELRGHQGAGPATTSSEIAISSSSISASSRPHARRGRVTASPGLLAHRRQR